MNTLEDRIITMLVETQVPITDQATFTRLYDAIRSLIATEVLRELEARK